MLEKILVLCLIVHTNGQTSQPQTTNGQNSWVFDLPPLNLQPLQLRLNPLVPTPDTPALLLIKQNESIPVISLQANSPAQWGQQIQQWGQQSAVQPQAQWGQTQVQAQAQAQAQAHAQVQAQAQTNAQAQAQANAQEHAQAQPAFVQIQPQQWLQQIVAQPQFQWGQTQANARSSLVQIPSQQWSQQNNLIQLQPLQQISAAHQPTQPTAAQPKEQAKPLVLLAFQSQVLQPFTRQQLTIQPLPAIKPSAPKAVQQWQSQESNRGAIPTWVNNLKLKTQSQNSRPQLSQTFTTFGSKPTQLSQLSPTTAQQSPQTLTRNNIPKESAVTYDNQNVNTVIQSLSAYTPNQLPAQSLLFNQSPAQTVAGQQVSPQVASEKNTQYFPTVTLPAVNLPANELPVKMLDLSQFLQLSQPSNNAISSAATQKNPDRSGDTAEAATLTPQTTSASFQPRPLSSFASLQSSVWSNPSPLRSMLAAQAQRQAELQDQQQKVLRAQQQVQLQDQKQAQQQQQQVQLQTQQSDGQQEAVQQAKQQTIQQAQQQALQQAHIQAQHQQAMQHANLEAALQTHIQNQLKPRQSFQPQIKLQTQQQTLQQTLQQATLQSQPQTLQSAAAQPVIGGQSPYLSGRLQTWSPLTASKPSTSSPQALNIASPLQVLTAPAPQQSQPKAPAFLQPLKPIKPLQSWSSSAQPKPFASLTPSQLPSPLTLSPLTAPTTPATTTQNQLTPLKAGSFRSVPFQTVPSMKWSNGLPPKQSLTSKLQSFSTETKATENSGKKLTLATIKQTFTTNKLNGQQWTSSLQNNIGNSATATKPGQQASQGSNIQFGARLTQFNNLMKSSN